jgi:16S rRNA (guanine966-N2)-methyltransferase
MLPGARVLDLFSGSGALGLEALSRGAASAVLVERDPGLAAALRATTGRLPGGEAAAVVQADALAWLSTQPRASFDLAFVDPPFDAGLHATVLPALVPLLGDAAWLYVECAIGGNVAMPPGWCLHREGRTREVHYALYRRVPSADVPADTLDGDPAGIQACPNEPRD